MCECVSMMAVLIMWHQGMREEKGREGCEEEEVDGGDVGEMRRREERKKLFKRKSNSKSKR